jgi:hypothetical protein
VGISSLMGTYDRGWKLVRLYGVREPRVCTCWKGKDCGTPGKHPVQDQWPNHVTSDEDEIAAWFDGDTPTNVGVLLGPSSGIIDVELDGDEAAQAWSELGLGDIDTPTYLAGRGPHRLFRWDESLPSVQVAKWRGIEFRFGNGGKASQSVIPPSRHHSGNYYQWVPGLSPSDVEPQPIPERLLTLLWNDDGGPLIKPRRHACTILHEPVAQAADGPGRNNELHRFAVHQAFRLGPDIERPQAQSDLIEILYAVNATKCKPPLPADEVRSIFRSALSYVRKTHAAGEQPEHAMRVDGLGDGEPEAECDATAAEPAEPAAGGKKHKRPQVRKTTEAFTETGLSFAPVSPGADSDPEWGPGEWQLTIVHSDPLEYRLHVPAWKRYTVSNTGNVSLSVDQYRSATKVAAAVLAATGRVMLDAEPGLWKAIWDGGIKVRDGVSNPKTARQRKTRGVKAKLLDSAVEEWPGASSQRYVALAGWLYDRLANASQPNDEDAPDPAGRAAWRQDGTLWFSWSRVWEDIERSHKVSEGERLALKRRLLGRLDLPDWDHGRFRHLGDTRRTYVVWTRREFAALETMANEEGPREDAGGSPYGGAAAPGGAAPGGAGERPGEAKGAARSDAGGAPGGGTGGGASRGTG